MNNFTQKIIKINKGGLARQSVRVGGFTLIETMVAVFILTISLTAFFSIVASSLFAARYANNEITATYLLQEAADSIRNDRDTMQEIKPGDNGWKDFHNRYDTCFKGSGCEIEPQANTISTCNTPASQNFGTINCALFKYDPDAQNNDFYTYQTVTPPQGVVPTDKNQCMSYRWQTYNNPPFSSQGGCISYVQKHIGAGLPINFKRKVFMIDNSNPDEIDVIITVEWQNGNLTRSQSLTTSLLNWRKNF